MASADVIAVSPPSQAIEVRGHRFLLEQMTGQAWVDWLELRVLAARELVTAANLAAAGEEHTLREVLETIHMSEYAMVLRVVGADNARLVEQMGQSERQQICKIQDTLNGLDQLEPLLRPYAHKVLLG